MTCYMCHKPSTTREHVPPDCFFPKGHKRNLITVPSCPDHNLRKSKDDEYVRSIIAPFIASNPHGETLALTKVNRSFERSEGLVDAVFRGAKIVRLAPGVETAAITVDLDRWDRFFQQFSNAMYFHDFNVPHRQVWDILTPSLTTQTSTLSGQPNPYSEVNRKLLSLDFVEQPVDNPEIFRYSFFKYSSTSYAYKFVFYEGFIVCALTTSGGRASA
jgi:hypothetical protein